jgi:hypothetical protein
MELEKTGADLTLLHSILVISSIVFISLAPVVTSSTQVFVFCRSGESKQRNSDQRKRKPRKALGKSQANVRRLLKQVAREGEKFDIFGESSELP